MDISSEIIVGDDGTIYVIGYYTLYAIDPSSGQFLWTWEVPENVPHPDNPEGTIFTKGQIGALALTDQGDLVLGTIGSGVYSRALYCIDTNGSTRWYNLNASGWGVYSGIFIGKNDALFYYTSFEQEKLMSVSVSSGAILWSKNVWGVGAAANNILIEDDGSLICSFKKSADEPMALHRVDPSNGNIQWSSSAESNWSTKWLGPDGAVYQYFMWDGGSNPNWFPPLCFESGPNNAPLRNRTIAFFGR